VWENLYFHGRLFGISAAASKTTASELLEQFQLAKWAAASVYALSGGMAHMQEVEQLCDRVAIMNHGNILALDTPENLKKSTGIDTILTLKASGDLTHLAANLLEHVEGATHTRLIDNGVELHVARGDQLLTRVIAAADASGSSVHDLSVAEPSLETVFINLTGKELRDT